MATVSPEALTDGRWYHIAVVTDRDQRSLYVDGVRQVQHLIAPTRPGTTPGPVFVGATQGKRDFLKGLIDEFAIYNRALSADEGKVLARGCSESQRNLR